MQNYGYSMLHLAKATMFQFSCNYISAGADIHQKNSWNSLTSQLCAITEPLISGSLIPALSGPVLKVVFHSHFGSIVPRVESLQ